MSEGTIKRKGDFKMENYYWMDIENGDLIPETDLYRDAEEKGYEDVTDPTSCEYRNFNLHYQRTNWIVE